MKCNKILFSILELSFSFIILSSCSNKNEPIEPSLPPTEPTIKVNMEAPKYVFGFLGQKKYSYCPSVLKQDDGSTHMFFCGNPQNQIMVDNIFHIKINPDGSQTPAKSVLQPGISGSWDDHHTCDPSVIEGEFKWNNTVYKYAMFFLSNMYGVYYNEIGVAFSNNLEADSWVKYPSQIIKKTWSNDGDQIIGGGGKSWGVGQPSVVSLDGKGELLLTYTIGDIGGTRIVWSKLDFSDMNSYTISTPKTIVQSGLYDINGTLRDYTCNSDFAINQDADKILMIRPIQPMPNDYPNYLNTSLEIDYMNLSDFMNNRGNWTPIYRVSPQETGYPRNHNAALVRDNFGHIEDWELPEFYFTVSKAEPEVQPSINNHAEWTYHIWSSKLIKE